MPAVFAQDLKKAYVDVWSDKKLKTSKMRSDILSSKMSMAFEKGFANLSINLPIIGIANVAPSPIPYANNDFSKPSFSFKMQSVLSSFYLGWEQGKGNAALIAFKDTDLIAKAIWQYMSTANWSINLHDPKKLVPVFQPPQVLQLSMYPTILSALLMPGFPGCEQVKATIISTAIETAVNIWLKLTVVVAPLTTAPTGSITAIGTGIVI